MRTMFMAASPKDPLEPGARFESESVSLPSVPKKLRPKRLVVKAIAHPPEMRFFTKSVGGSKRKGRRASLLYFASLMCHRPDTANLTIDSIKVDAVHQMMGPIPAAVFAPETIQMDADMDVGSVIRVAMTNHEEHRRVSVNAVVFVGEEDDWL